MVVTHGSFLMSPIALLLEAVPQHVIVHRDLPRLSGFGSGLVSWTDLYIRLIHPPGSADWPSITLPPILEFRQVMLDPTQDGRMCERNASIRHHDHQVPEAQFETCVPADAKNDDLSVEMPTREQSLDRNKSTHPAMILHS